MKPPACTIIGTIAVMSIWLTACAGQLAHRDSDRYREDSRALIMTKAPNVKSCYDQALKADPKVAGTVVLHFKVQPETGQVIEARLDDKKTTAPGLGRCVLQVMDGLKLEPPDASEGLATFAWEFRPRG